MEWHHAWWSWLSTKCVASVELLVSKSNKLNKKMKPSTLPKQPNKTWLLQHTLPYDSQFSPYIMCSMMQTYKLVLQANVTWRPSAKSTSQIVCFAWSCLAFGVCCSNVSSSDWQCVLTAWTVKAPWTPAQYTRWSMSVLLQLLTQIKEKT